MSTVVNVKKTQLKQYFRMLPLSSRRCTNDADSAELRAASYETTFCGSGSKLNFKGTLHPKNGKKWDIKKIESFLFVNWLLPTITGNLFS